MTKIIRKTKQGKVPVTRIGKTGYGIAIADAYRNSRTTLADSFKTLAKQDTATLNRAFMELEEQRKRDIEAAPDDAAKASEKASYSRLLRIVRGLRDGIIIGGTDCIQQCRNIQEMAALVPASGKGGATKGATKVLKAEQVQKINRDLRRIVGPMASKSQGKGHAAYLQQVGRLESVYREALALLVRHADATMIPVRDVLKLARGKRAA